MTNNPNELTVENSVVILIDHQPWVAFSVHSIDPGLMMNNVAALIFPDLTPIDRTSTHAWSHPEVRAAVDATRRKKLIMAGLVTEVCLCQSVLAALKDGFDVYFVSDCSGGITPESHEDAKARMVQAGAKPISLWAVLGEWAPDYTSAERQALTSVTRERGGLVAAMADYVFAQVEAGLVKAPSFGSAPAAAQSR